ncbi:MAG: metal transporter [Methylacidiphilaceae bacterium]|nr:metal transporter [Candidatus Methylacidiphilaceae bacterium]
MKRSNALFAIFWIIAGWTSAIMAEPLPPALGSVMPPYLALGKALSDDSLKGVPSQASAMKSLVEREKSGFFPKELPADLDRLAKATDLDTARLAYKDISDRLIALFRDHHVQTGHYFVCTCPMAQASWIQIDKEIKNPFYGSVMLLCGDVTETF